MPDPLEHIQRVFAAALADNAHVTALLPLIEQRDVRAAERIALYRGNLSAVWEKALADAYLVSRQLVGEEFFNALARAYGSACPSQSGDLNRFGDRFAQFVATFAHAQSLPYLSDVARLEWSVYRAQYAADAPSISRTRLVALLPEQLLHASCLLHPACAWIESPFPIVTIWQAHQDDAAIALPDKLDQAEYALVVRPQWRAHVLSSSAAEFAALARMREGKDFAAVIESGLEVDARFDFAAALLRWLEHRLLVDLHVA